MKDVGMHSFPSIAVEAEVHLIDFDSARSEASLSLDLRRVSEVTGQRQARHPVEAVAVVRMDSFQSFEASSCSV